MTILSTKEEVWRDIPGYEGQYQASSLGRIKSVTRRVTQMSRWGKLFTRTMPGRILRPAKFCSSGHVSVVLGHGVNGSPVHQLIILTFKGPPPEGMEVRHLNGDPGDNQLENLVYGTRTENILDVYRQGKAWRKLTAEQALEIKDALRNGEPGVNIAKAFNISQSVISAIKHGRIYWWLS